MKKGFGFICAIISAVLAAAALAMYGGSYTTNQDTYMWMGIALAVDVIAIILALVVKKGEWINWIPVIGAVVTMWGLLQSVNIMLDAVGYVVSGLYVFSDIQGWVIFMGLAVAAFLFDVIGGFAKVVK